MPDQMCRGGKFIFNRIEEAKAEGCHAKKVVMIFSFFWKRGGQAEKEPRSTPARLHRASAQYALT
jgi:hypothetical protein